MKKGTGGEARLHVGAPPEMVFELVSDISRMSEWSPETIKCEWLDDATRPVVGARFKGVNRRGIARWSTKPVVTAVEPGRQFAFETPDTAWTYRFEPSADGGTDLIESFVLTKDEPSLLAFASRYLLRIRDRRSDLEAAMDQTLHRIKAAAEGTAG